MQMSFETLFRNTVKGYMLMLTAISWILCTLELESTNHRPQLMKRLRGFWLLLRKSKKI